MTDWTGVRERVMALGAASGGDKVFGAMGQGFALDAPLTGPEVADLETCLGVELPEEYRSFLLQVGAGGAGPAYGVFPVRRDGSDGWTWVGDAPEQVEPGMVRIVSGRPGSRGDDRDPGRAAVQ
ncbi:SMI1/KNR4 family protein [Streptomyces sp. NPDC058202]|uniref:SMI1/KNR4 family protein n=1 Tax=Streptomyces sp. NPDC058202 TaxID=3346380 RepID=UPI0036E9248E